MAAAVGIELLTEEDVELGEDTFRRSESLAALCAVSGASTPFLCIRMERNLTLPPGDSEVASGSKNQTISAFWMLRVSYSRED